MKQSYLKDLEQIPGVGKRIAQEMQNIGLHSIDQLKDQNPRKLYQKLCDVKASPPDRCMLYVLRWDRSHTVLTKTAVYSFWSTAWEL